MLRLSSDQLTPGMIVGRSIVDASGRMLLAGGQVLSQQYILRIQDLDIPTIYIDDQLGIEDSPSPVSSATVSKATTYLKQSYQQCVQTGKINISAIKAQVDNIIDELVANGDLLVGMADLKSYDEYTYQHSVNVCVLAVMMGVSKGYNRFQLQTLGVGAILHDIGKINVPVEILNQPGSLSDEDFNIIKQHPWHGFKIIKDSGGIALLSAHVALQHHEHLDGKGYPRGLNAAKIHEYGQITGVADMFDALVSDRPYRRGYNNHDALNIVQEAKGHHLSPEFVDLLLTHINLYPPGTVVVLTTKDIAIVTKENPEEPRRPQVKLLFNAQQQAYAGERVVNLADYKTIYITKTHSNSDGHNYIARYLSLHPGGFGCSTLTSDCQ